MAIPLLVPKAISLYRSAFVPPPGIVPPPIIAAPNRISQSLGALFGVSLMLFLRTLPFLSPENVFVATQSRLKAPVDVVFRRLATLRPSGVLTSHDESLRAHLVAIESRLLYLQYGPDVLAGCPFCRVEEPKSYFYYALPSLLIPHVLNLIFLGLVTSAFISGPGASRWRKPITLAAVALAVIDVYAVGSYNVTANATANRLGELDNFFWSARIYRYTAIAVLNGLLGWAMWLAATNRAFLLPPTPAQRVANATTALTIARSRLNAVGIVKNTVTRDDELQRRDRVYWAQEKALTAEAMEEQEVVRSLQDAMANRVNIENLTHDANAYAAAMMETVRVDRTGSSVPEASQTTPVPL